MQIKLDVKNCSECPHLEETEYRSGQYGCEITINYICSKGRFAITNQNKISKDCPYHRRIRSGSKIV